MADDQDESSGLSRDEKIVRQAKKDFKRAADHEYKARNLFLDDLKFDAGDPDNNYQWPNQLLGERNGQDRPSLTINKTHQHNLQIINDGKQNKPAIKIIATGGNASFKSAQVYSDVCRNIEYRSNAESAYDTALSFAVRAGIGYVRVIADYEKDVPIDPQDFKAQTLFIRRVKDPLSVYLDPDISEEDGSDARFGFIFEDKPKEEVWKEYPKTKNISSSTTMEGDNWVSENHIRIAEYYRRVEVVDKLLLMTEPDQMPDGTDNPNKGQTSLKRESELPKEIVKLVREAGDVEEREICTYKVEWYKIVGETIVDRRVGDEALPIPYVPICRCVGEETVIEGRLDRKSHTRALKDPQRMLNYNASGAVEFGALQSKTPYIGPARAIEGNETYWRTANRVNHAILTYNDVDEDAPEGAQIIAAPVRQQPPTSAPVFMQGMQDAVNQMMMASGQYQSQSGEQENAKTLPSIMQRQRAGDNATYHFVEGQARMIRLVGKILIAWIPKVMDTKRIINIRAEDGDEKQITIDPAAPQALHENKQVDHRTQEAQVETIFNPNVGKYDVQADVGPGFATKRQDAWNTYSQIVANNPDLMSKIGDLVLKCLDAPYSDEMAERLKRGIDPALKGEGPPPQVAELTLQMENMKSALADLLQQLAEKDIKLKAQGEDKRIDSYNAVTNRLKVEGASVDPSQLAALVTQAVMTSLQIQLPVDGNGPDVPAATQDEGMPQGDGMPQQQAGM